MLGYLSFLASNSAIAYDFIALADQFGFGVFLGSPDCEFGAVGRLNDTVAEVARQFVMEKERVDEMGRWKVSLVP